MAFKFKILLVLALVVGVVAGQHITTSPIQLPSAVAACGTPITCTNDGTATGSLTVDHIHQDGQVVTEVEPNDGETWDITATWSTDSFENPGTCACFDQVSAAVSADVQWSDSSGWSVTCTGCAGAGPIVAVSVCDGDGCGSGPSVDNSWEYELIVDVIHTNQVLCGGMHRNTYLTSVNFDTTTVDDGNLVDTSDCSEGSAVESTSQAFSATDTATFECGFDCSATGASVTITYE